jgi:hypothetical protein
MNNALTLLEQFLARQPRSLEARFTLARLLSQAGRADARFHGGDHPAIFSQRDAANALRQAPGRELT